MEVIEHHTRQRTEAAAPRPRRLTDRFERLLDRRGVSTAIMAAALLLTALAWFAARDFADNEARQRFERRSDEVHRRIATRMAAYEALLHSAAGLLAAQPETDRASWARYIATLAPDQHLPGVQGVGVARLLQEGELDGFERAVRAEGFADFHVRPEGHDAGERSSIVYLEPLAGRNLRAFGFDMLSEPVRREAMLRARDGRQIALSGTVTLMQEDGQDVQQGLLMYLPVFRNTGAQGERHWGWVYAAFRVHDLMVGILGRESPDIDFSVRDAAEDAAFFATTGTDTAPPPARHSSTDRLLRTLEVAGRRWTITYADRSGPGGADTRGANLVALCGLATDVLLFWSLRNSRRRRAQAERQAAARSDEARTRLSWLTAVSGLSPDAILVFARTQTERRRSAAETVGAELRLVFSNPAFSEWFGLRPEDLEGLSEPAVAEWLDGLAHGDNAQPLLAPGEATVLLAGPPLRVLRRGMREDGRQRVYYYRDVTRETEVERLKNEFLTTAAHELRTPLASVYGFAELLVHKRVDAARLERTVAIIHRQAGVLNHLVNALLDLARIDSRGAADFRCERLDLRQLAEMAAESMLRPDEPPRVQLALGAQACWVRLDATKSRQAIVNVLSNAIKYSPAGTPVAVTLAAAAHDGRPGVALQVRDQGVGMSPEQCARAFERFYRADPSGHILGAGLGLSIVKTLVELQQGQVKLASTPGAGTTVTLWWPLDHVEAAGADAPVETPDLAEA